MSWEPSSSSADATRRGHCHGQQREQQHRAKRSCVHEWDWQSRDTCNKRRRQIHGAESIEQLHQIEAQLREHTMVFVAGATGCGKTTRVPWHLAQAFGKPVACCLPRRLQARSAAKYVRGVLPEAKEGNVGWAVGGDTGNSGQQLTYFTHGCFLQQRWETLGHRFGVVIVDEAHEQSMETLLVFWILRHVLKNHSSLKLVVMSATMDVTALQRYFGCAQISFPSAVINLGTCSHPVEVIQLDDIPSKFPTAWQQLKTLCKQPEGLPPHAAGDLTQQKSVDHRSTC